MGAVLLHQMVFMKIPEKRVPKLPLVILSEIPLGESYVRILDLL